MLKLTGYVNFTSCSMLISGADINEKEDKGGCYQ